MTQLKKRYGQIVSVFTLFSSFIPTSMAATLAPVSGFAHSFLFDKPLVDAKVTVLETGQQIKTDANGEFHFSYPVGKPVTLVLEKWGYKTTQTGTTIVPVSGLTGAYANISLQVPSIIIYYLFVAAIGAHIDDNSCHVTSTITAYHKTLADIPQGEAGASAVLTPSASTTPFYFDIFTQGPLKSLTNPFTKGLTLSSADGGVAFFNLTPRKELYKLSATKNGITFSETQFLCRKGMFINLSPPYGPMVKKVSL